MGGEIKVLTVIGTRPEAIKLFPLIHALEADPRFQSRVCVTGQHREMVDEVLRITEVVPNHDLDLMRHGQSLDEIAAGTLLGLGRVCREEQPNWVVVQGDTTSAMTAAVVAHHARIAICHVEAGLRTGDPHNPWPEEGNRRVIAAIARLHCAPTAGAAAALRAENIPSSTIHVTGNTGVDALLWMRRKLASNAELAPAAARLCESFAGRTLIVATVHRREAAGPPLERIAAALARIADRDDVAIVVPMHPNGALRDVLRRRLAGKCNVALIEPLPYGDFVYLLERSDLVLTDSGGVQEEGPVLGVPVLVMREATERPEAIECGLNRLIGTDTHGIVAAVERGIASLSATVQRSGSSPYGDGAAAPRIAALLAGETASQAPV